MSLAAAGQRVCIYFRRMERTFADMVMMTILAIQVENLGKRYRIGSGTRASTDAAQDHRPLRDR